MKSTVDSDQQVGFFYKVKSIRQYENPESYEWWSYRNKLEDCDLQIGKERFKDLKASPQNFEEKIETSYDRQIITAQWSYKKATKEREDRFEEAENYRRPKLKMQAVFLQEYKKRFESF